MRSDLAAQGFMQPGLENLWATCSSSFPPVIIHVRLIKASVDTSVYVALTPSFRSTGLS